MLLNNEYYDFLKGSKFSTGVKLPLFDVSSQGKLPLDRLNYLKTYCSGKKVLHVGCCDHKDVIVRKRTSHVWTHDILTECAEKCLGIDIETHTIEWLRLEQNIQNIIECDITQPIPDNSLILSEKWDIIVLGEVVEHIGNPVLFLQKFYENFNGVAKEIVVTVPNAFNANNLISAQKGIEHINTDHRFWFTPFTIAKVITDAGFHCTEINFVYSFPQSPLPRKNFIKRWYMQKQRSSLHLREGLICHAFFGNV